MPMPVYNTPCVYGCIPFSNIECDKCIIRRYTKRMNKLIDLNNGLMDKKNLRLESVSKYAIAEFQKYITISNCEQCYEIEDFTTLQPNHFFVTITFDPNLFGEDNNEEDEMNYILNELMQLIKMKYTNAFYGCFEFQNKGAIHAHVAMSVLFSYKEIYKYLKSRFTVNKMNRNAIDIGLMKGDWCCYINKCNKPDERGNTFFRYNLKSFKLYNFKINSGEDGQSPDESTQVKTESSPSVLVSGVAPIRPELADIPKSIAFKINLINYYKKEIKKISSNIPQKFISYI